MEETKKRSSIIPNPYKCVACLTDKTCSQSPQNDLTGIFEELIEEQVNYYSVF